MAEVASSKMYTKWGENAVAVSAPFCKAVKDCNLPSMKLAVEHRCVSKLLGKHLKIKERVFQ